jgi:hypothetical protein
MLKFGVVILAVALIVTGFGMLQLNTEAAASPKGGGCPAGTNCNCSFVFAPVQCGKAKCRYTNFCYAQCAGWTAQDCNDVP